MGIPISRVEFLDEYSVQATNRHSGTTYRETPTLFFEFTGSEHNVTEQVTQVTQTSVLQTLAFGRIAMIA